MSASRIIFAVDFAAKAHGTQKRKNALGFPYIVHPIGVAKILTEEAHVDDIVVLEAALLHDIAEDTRVTLQEIEKAFGATTAGIVAELTDDKSLPKEERKKLQIINAPHKSRAAKLVKLADKLYNLRDLLDSPPGTWAEHRIQGYFVWARAVVRGLRGTNAALESALDKVFASSFSLDGKTFPCIPEGDETVLLQQYYALMTISKD